MPGTVRLGGALIAAAVGLGGAAVAYAGELPGPVQDLAHHLIGAPPAHSASPLSPRSGPGMSRPEARHGSHPGRAKGHGKRGKHAHGKATVHAKGRSKPAAARTPPRQARHHPAHPPLPT
jgi:hypothetical protein